MRRFPLCAFSAETLAQWEPFDHRIFHLRFYLPHESVLRRGPRIDRVVVMVNGLDEFDSYGFYDKLGAHFARAGVAAVLLPLPDHMNRHPLWRGVPEHQKRQNADPPSRFILQGREHPFFYRRLRQWLIELEVLRLHLTHASACECEDMAFFRTWFTHSTTVSLFGFSLGGLAALVSLLWKPDVFKSATLLNSGVPLEKLYIPWLKDDWDDFTQIAKASLKHPQRVNLYEDTVCADEPRLDSLIREVFFDRPRECKVPSLLEPYLSRLFFVSCGGDQVSPPAIQENWRPPNKGLFTLTIPEASHFVDASRAFGRWSDLALSVVREFESVAGNPWTVESAAAELVRLNRKYGLRVISEGRIDRSQLADRDDLATWEEALATYGVLRPREPRTSKKRSADARESNSERSAYELQLETLLTIAAERKWFERLEGRRVWSLVLPPAGTLDAALSVELEWSHATLVALDLSGEAVGEEFSRRRRIDASQ